MDGLHVTQTAANQGETPLPPLTYETNADGSVTATSNGWRMFTAKAAGNLWTLTIHGTGAGTTSDQTRFAMDDNGYPTVTKN